jgi:hypothetical protein
MSHRRHQVVRVHTFSPDDQDKLLAETILQWRALGPSAAWRAAFDLLGWWFSVRGLDPEAQRVDRTRIEVHPVPWLAEESVPEVTEARLLKESSRA